MKRLRELIISTVPPSDTSVLWLNPIDNRIMGFSRNGWINFSVGNSVSTDELEDECVTTEKIADSAITGDKISSDAITLSKEEGSEDIYAATYELRINDETNTLIGTIDIPKDQHLRDVKVSNTEATLDEDGYIVDGDDGETALVFSYYMEDGSYKIAILNLQQFIEETEYGDGLEIIDHKLYVKISSDSETAKYLSVDSNGIKLQGVDKAIEDMADKINEDINALKEDLNAEIEQREKADSVLQDNIDEEIATRKEADDTLQNNIDALEEELSNNYATLQLVVNLHASITFSANRTVIYKGESDTVTLSHNATFDGSPLTYTLTVDGAALANPYTLEDSHTFTGVFSIDNDDPDVAMDITRTITVNAYYPRYYGYLDSDTITADDVTTLTKQARASSAALSSLSVTFATSGYLWLCVPSGMTINSVTSSGFAVPMEDPVTVSVTDKGDYLCYRSTNEVNAGTVTYVIS